MKALKAFVKSFEAPQRSIKKIKLIVISIQLSEMHEGGRVKLQKYKNMGSVQY